MTTATVGVGRNSAVPCAHIAAYYEKRWSEHKCLAFNFLRVGYLQWAEGRADGKINNLYGGNS
jgi:hypothetical protein